MAQLDTHEAHEGILATIAPRRWGPVIFGVVSEDEIRRRPSDIVRAAFATVLVIVTAVAAGTSTSEHHLFRTLSDLPAWSHTISEWAYRAGTAGAVVLVVVALLVARRLRVVGRLAVAGGGAWLLGVILRASVDSVNVREAAGFAQGVPAYPVVRLAATTAALLVVTPFLVRPARRAVLAVVVVGAAGGFVSAVGLPIDIVGALALGWGVAAVVHLSFGTPAATPTESQVRDALFDVGVNVSGLRLADKQVWGEARFVAFGPNGEPVSVEVLGRDASDARLMKKLTRSVLYRDSGPSLQITRSQQLEHRAYVLLLAAKAGVPVSEVVVAGIAGAHEDAVLVLRTPRGMPLPEVERGRITDAVLDRVWESIARLRAARLAHGQLGVANVLLGPDDTVAIMDFAHGSSVAPPERVTRDCVEFLATSAALVGVERALAAADRSLGSNGLRELLPLLEPAALSRDGRHGLTDRKRLFAALREGGAELAHEEAPKLAELRRVAPGQVVMAIATLLGFYLIINQFAGVDLWATLQNAEPGWLVVAAALSLLPQLTGSIALPQGAVATPLPFVPVVAEQFANNFTGLIGGTVANTALVIRFFQKNGQTVAVAASSGVLNSLAGGIVQVTLVVVGLLLTGSSFDLSSAGGSSDVGRIMVIAVVAIGVLVGVSFMIPRLRRAVRGILQPQLRAAESNLRGVLSTPKKAAMLFGGNLGSQVIFALVLEASLHAYGYSLPVLQLIVINSLASVLGGMAPVPGGLGVIEAGLIGGMTAAGIPQAVAVAATFTERLFTAYLPPIWGWFALRWLRQHDYV